MSDTFHLDPSPEEWLSVTRIDNLRSELGNAVPLIKSAGVLPNVLRYWIRRELGETDDNPSAPMAWARNHWGHRLDNLFLQRKDCLDQASFRLLRVKQQGLSLELYHRLLAQESTFAEVSTQYGIGPERYHGGLMKHQVLSSLPALAGQILRRLQAGEVTKPLSIGKQFWIIQLIRFVPAVYCEDTEHDLLDLELQNWLDGMSSHVECLLNSMQ